MNALLSTKLYFPTIRSNLVPRPRLIERLNEGLHGPVTLIAAPAGYGKTTLMGEWRTGQGCDIPVAWLSLDESDNDPIRFWSYFISALDTLQPGLMRDVHIMLESSQPPPIESLFTILINNINSLSKDFVFALDDVHVIDTPEIYRGIDFLLGHMPPCMHLVLISRADPPIALSRLRANGQLFEIRANDLIFNSEETATFLNNVMKLELSTDEIMALEARTEGWVAGLQLAALSMQDRKDVDEFILAFTGSHYYILDYLADEVLLQQPENIQTFLLQTAILDRLTGSLCDVLTGQDNGQVTLEKLERANLFLVPLDEGRRWYRYHHLFADLLRQQLRQIQPDQLQVLYCRASEWHEQNGFADEAIEYALKAEDFKRAARLIENAAEAEWVRNKNSNFRRWLDGLPVEVVSSRPRLCIFQAWQLYLNGQMEEAARSLQVAEQSLDLSTKQTNEVYPIADDQPLDKETMKLLGRVAAVRSVLVYSQGDVKEIIQCARQALEYLPKDDISWRSTAIMSLGDAYDFIGDVSSTHQARLEALELSKISGNPYMILFASLDLVVNLRDMGCLQQALEMCQQQLEIANKSGLSQTVGVGWLYLLWSEVLAEKNELDRALQLAIKGAKLIERGKEDVIMLGWSYLCFIRVLYSRGDFEHAEEIIQKINELALEHEVTPWISNQIKAWQARIWLAQNKMGLAAHWVRELEVDLDGELTPVHDFDYIIIARILIAQERFDETSRLLQRLFAEAEEGNRTSKMIEILILQAIAFQASGDNNQSMIKLEKALTLAEPGGFVRIFLDEGEPIHILLKTATSSLKDKALLSYARTLLATSGDKSGQPQVPEQPIIIPLSERELQVLRLVASGKSNQEIAVELVIALGTVKRHIFNIYNKLDVKNRTECVARARALRLLE